MRGKRTILGVGLALGVLGSVGCTTCSHKAYAEALRPVEETSISIQARARVNVFLLNGADLFELGGMPQLREAILAAGYPKVYYAQRYDREWYRRELHRLHREDPTNRFVLVASGTAADQLRILAVQVSNEGIPLDHVVFIDPAGEGTNLTDCPFPSLVIRSQNWLFSPRLKPTETMVIGGVRHGQVTKSPVIVEQILAILTGSAMRVPIVFPPVECVPVINENRPIPRPDQPKVLPPLPPDWHALCPPGN